MTRIDGKGKLAKDRHPITPSPTVISKLALIVAAAVRNKILLGIQVNK
jgi:hypothetical protein